MSILLFVVVFTLTILLQRWLHQHIQGLALALTGDSGCGLRVLFYLLLPGVLLHELSHFTVAKVLLVRTSKFQIGLGNTRARRVSLGSVNIERTDPLRESLIGLAPFIFGVAAIWLIAAVGFDVLPQTAGAWDLMIHRIQEYANDWTTWLDLYFIFAVSTAMIPSESDREPWGPVITFIVVAVIVLFVLGWTPRIPPDVVTLARNGLDALTFALGLAVVVNGSIAVILWLTEQTLAHLSGNHIDYHVKRK
jgi:hypothetical protein